MDVITLQQRVDAMLLVILTTLHSIEKHLTLWALADIFSPEQEIKPYLEAFPITPLRFNTEERGTAAFQ